MTDYCINPNAIRLAVYNLNTGTMPTNNVIFSHITADLSSSATSIEITNGEGNLFTGGMIATIEQLNADGKATAREVVLINSIEGNTVSITRGYESCVMNDLANPKVLGNTPQSFTTGAKISVYISKALLNGVQTRLENVNKPCNTCVYNESLEVSNCVNQNFNARCDCLVDTILERCYCNTMGDGSDGDCTISGTAYLDANCEYNFDNLTIEEGAILRFIGCGTPIIRVKHCLCNMGTIDLRGGTYVGICSKTDVLTGCSVCNNTDLAAYNAMCRGCAGTGGVGKNNGTNGTNAASSTCGGNGGNGGDGNVAYGGYGEAGCLAEGANGGRGGNGGGGYGSSNVGYSDGGGGGGGAGGADYGNGGNGGSGGTGSSRNGYAGGGGGSGGNSGIFGKGGDGGANGGGDGIRGPAGNGGNGYFGGVGGTGYNYCTSANGGAGGKGIVCGGAGGSVNIDRYNRGTGGTGGNAIDNMYGMILYACAMYNCIITAEGGRGGDGGCSYCGAGGNGGNGANGGHIIVGYYKTNSFGTITADGGCGGNKGGTYNCCCSQGNDGTPGNDGTRVLCNIDF